MAATPQAGALVKARIDGKQGTHRIRVEAVSDTDVSFRREWSSKGEAVRGKKAYTLPLSVVEVVEVLDPKPAPKVEERPRRGRPRKEPVPA